MAIVNSLNSSIYVNRQLDSAQNQSKDASKENVQKEQRAGVVLDAQYVKRLDESNEQQAKELFERANQYKEAIKQAPEKNQQSLNVYRSLDMLEQKETIQNMMGVDLYA